MNYAAMAIKLTNLPDGALEMAAGYLSKPARALLLVAISPNKDLISSAHTIFTYDDWSSLDFGELETELASRLTDSHIHSILECIDATHKLTSLKMHGCTSILGHGLELLRRSTAITRLDVVITKDRNDPFKLSEERMLPIIDDIMAHQSMPTLEVVQLPMNWENGYASEAAIQFALRYKQYKINRGRKCKICIDEGETDEESKCELVCYGCFTPFHELICPSKMGWPLGMHKSKLQPDDSCRRMYCETCYKANVFFCAWCGHHPWNGGDKLFCNECSPLTKCEECGYSACDGCAHLHIKQCSNCLRTRCDSCEYYEYREDLWDIDQFLFCETCLDSTYVKENYWMHGDHSERRRLLREKEADALNEESDDEGGKSEDYDDEGEESDASASNLQFYEAMYNDAVERHKLPDCF